MDVAVASYSVSGQAQASAVCLPLCIRCCSPSHVLGAPSPWICLVSLLSHSPHPALTTSLYPGGAGDLYCELQCSHSYSMTSLAPIMYFTFALFIFQ